MDKKTVTLASLALLGQVAPALAATSADQGAAAQDTMTSASQEAIRHAWLKIPPMCKDRSIAFDAAKVAPEAAPAELLALYAELA
jgi:hypothetical protein